MDYRQIDLWACQPHFGISEALESADSESVSHQIVGFYGTPSSSVPRPIITSPFHESSATSSLPSPTSTGYAISPSSSYAALDVEDPRTFEGLEASPSKPTIVTLIRAALLASPEWKATLDQIPQLISKNYKDVKRFRRLKGSVRQRLSCTPWFELRDRPHWKVGKGQYWTYVEELDESIKSLSSGSRSRGGSERARHPRQPHTRPRKGTPTPLHPDDLVISDRLATPIDPNQSFLHSLPSISHLSTYHSPTIPLIPTSPDPTLVSIAPCEEAFTWPDSSIVPTMAAMMINHSPQHVFGDDSSRIPQLLWDLRSVSSPTPGITVTTPDLEAIGGGGGASWMQGSSVDAEILMNQYLEPQVLRDSDDLNRLTCN
ncbi:hypothetical protein FRB93_008919 [Tulasnella sp. JGI-2019a]|nr:hypothetical protein FRB93_008919 [Tulasnella sp. JGI-2019a]